VKQLLSDYLSNILLHKPDDVFKFTQDYFSILATQAKLTPVLVVVGPNSVGKSILISKLLEQFPDKFTYLTFTTSKQNKAGFLSVTKERFLHLLNENELIYHHIKDDDYEGVTKEEVYKTQKSNKIGIIEIDITGAKQIYQTGFISNYIAVLPASIEQLRTRVKDNKKLNTDSINKILEISNKEIKEIEELSFFTHRIINDELNTSYNDFENAILSMYPVLKANYEELSELLKFRRDEIRSQIINTDGGN
jgi:guanylate kinase